MKMDELRESFKDSLLELYRENKWREVLDLNKDSKNLIALNFLWVWPSEENLDFIRRRLNEFQLNGIISLGCGCGLFEWILGNYLNLLQNRIPVLGYEVNKEWWQSRYSNPLFIQHYYPQFPINSRELDPNFALLFCYFNDGDAFIDYLDNFNGKVIFIIGPGEGRGTLTNPEPFNPKFGVKMFHLHSYQEVKDSKDFIAVYVREN